MNRPRQNSPKQFRRRPDGPVWLGTAPAEAPGIQCYDGQASAFEPYVRAVSAGWLVTTTGSFAAGPFSQRIMPAPNE